MLALRAPRTILQTEQPSSRCCLSHARRCVWWRQARRHDPSTGQACCLRFHLGPSLISLPLTLVGQLLRREACATGGLPWSAPSEQVSRSRGVAWPPDECSDQLGGSPGQRRRWQRQRQRAGLLLTAGQLPFGLPQQWLILPSTCSSTHGMDFRDIAFLLERAERARGLLSRDSHRDDADLRAGFGCLPAGVGFSAEI